jgi:hypothetical protein
MPTCALALNPEYPLGRQLRRRPQRASIHRGAPSPFGRCKPAAPLRHVPGFPRRRLPRELAPDPRHQGTLRLARPPERRRRRLSGSHVHCRSLDGIGAQLFPCGHDTPLRGPASCSPPGASIRRSGTEPPVRPGGPTHRLTRPVSIGFEPGSTLKGVLALVHFVTPLRLACRAHTVR